MAAPATLARSCCLVLAVAGSPCATASSSGRSSVAEPYYERPAASADLPFCSIPANLQCQTPPCSEQVHIQLGGPGEVVVSFASNASKRTPPLVRFGLAGHGVPWYASGSSNSFSQLIYWALPQTWNSTMGMPTLTAEEIAAIMTTTSWAKELGGGVKYSSWKNVSAEYVEKNISYPGTFGDYKNPAEQYDSPVLHTVTLKGLQGGETYEYGVADDSRTFQFTMPAAQFPFTFGITADVGQTQVSNVTFQTLKAMQPHTVLLAGDVSYADGYFPRWDSYGRLAEQLGAYIPVMYCPGDHEQFNGEAFVNYRARYPMPSGPSHSSNPLYWSRDIGPAHVISLNSYSGTANGTLQNEWLREDLATRFDRRRTPWLVVMMHVPWYNSNAAHIGEAELMRQDMEWLFYKYGVNVVLAGHTHSYERTSPVYNNRTDPCGPVYLNVGDGGNREGAEAFGFSEIWLPGSGGEVRPEWSIFRQATFGVGQLDLLNETHAKMYWRRHACFNQSANAPPSHENFNAENCTTTGDNSRNATLSEDEVVLVRPSPERCPNQAVLPRGLAAEDLVAAAAAAMATAAVRQGLEEEAQGVCAASCGAGELLNTTACLCLSVADLLAGQGRRLLESLV